MSSVMQGFVHHISGTVAEEREGAVPQRGVGPTTGVELGF